MYSALGIANHGRTLLPSKITVIETGTDDQMANVRSLYNVETTLNSEQEVPIRLHEPIVIQPERKYEIHLAQNTSKEHFNQIALKKEHELKDGIKIRFLEEGAGWDDSKFGLITKLYFKRA